MVILAMAAMLAAADVHGTVETVDRAHDLVVVHHHRHAGMAAEMTMAVTLRDRRQLRGLRQGQFVRLRCDARENPYVCELR